ncbi:hypothetical protein SEA_SCOOBYDOOBYDOO_99 [Mycobacterium phage ScoobyDoobyDoo]|nr:hypothetical protein SEA_SCOOBYDOOBYDOO_99 [Mycobacterium phage ScoobyDoobyDoo]
MSMVIPTKPGEWPQPVTVVEGQGDLPNPGDTSLESVNAFNKREDVRVSEQRYIDRDDLPGPNQDGPDSITSNDRVPRKRGNPDWKAPAYRIETARETDTKLSEIVPRSNEDSPVPTV